MAMIRVRHERIRSQKVVTALGPLDLDAQGEVEVDEETARELYSRYGNTYRYAGPGTEKKAPPRSPVKNGVQLSVSEGASDLDVMPKPEAAEPEDKAATKKKRPVPRPRRKRS